MTELIDKGALYEQMTEEYKKHYAGTGKGYDFTIAMQMVQNQPTVTEADIRAKAIDEFAEKFVFQAVCQGCSGCCNCYELGRQMQCGEYQRYMEIAEQLKGE